MLHTLAIYPTTTPGKKSAAVAYYPAACVSSGLLQHHPQCDVARVKPCLAPGQGQDIGHEIRGSIIILFCGPRGSVGGSGKRVIVIGHHVRHKERIT